MQTPTVAEIEVGVVCLMSCTVLTQGGAQGGKEDVYRCMQAQAFAWVWRGESLHDLAPSARTRSPEEGCVNACRRRCLQHELEK